MTPQNIWSSALAAGSGVVVALLVPGGWMWLSFLLVVLGVAFTAHAIAGRRARRAGGAR